MSSTLALGERQPGRTSAARGGSLRWLVLTACLPVSLFIVGAIVIGVREFRASAELREKQNQLKQLGQPYDSASYDQWYRNHTRSEGAQAWVRVLDTVSTTSQLAGVDSLAIGGMGKEIAELDPQVEWRDGPKVKEFLTEMRGLIQQIHQLRQWPTPVQLPLEIHGAQTLLPHYQQSRSLTRLLQVDFEYAFCHKELDRALEDLQSIGTVARAIDTDFCLVVDLIVMATVGTQQQEIQRSLLTESWPPEKLSELRKIVSNVRFTSAKWKALFTNERAMFADNVAAGDLSKITGTNDSALVPLLNTGRVRIFDAYDELINIGNSPLVAYKDTSKSVVENIIKRDATFDVDGASIWIGLMFPAVEAMARSVEHEESNRRLTLTAIALRQFKLREGRWPNRLIELEKVGLTTSDICTVNRGAFGYEIENGVAYLWGSDTVGDRPVSDERPDNYGERIDGVTVVTLR